MSEAIVPEQPQQQWTEDETEVFKLAFDLFDQNGDGFIDLEELDTGFIELGQKQRRSVLVRMIETVDENQDHKIDFKEFIELMKLRQLDDQLRKELDATNKEEGDEEEQAIEELLMSRFGNMSLNEDIRRGSLYGRLAATDETPQAIVTALKEMDVQIGKIPDKKKKAYLQAKDQCPLLMGDKFMLMFLRADRFIAKNAACRYVTYWDKRLEIFGPERAFLPLTQAGALKDDADFLKNGVLKHTGEKDDSNQVLLFLDFQQHCRSNKLDQQAMVREFWYSYHAALEDDDAQKYGIVILVRAPKTLKDWDPFVAKQYVDSIRFCLPTRLASGHVVNPPVLIRVMFRVIDLFAGNLRAVRKTHSGSPEKVLAQLEKYGIQKDAVPSELGGDLEVKHDEWLEQRRVAGV